MSRSKQSKVSRRDFLKVVGIGAGATVLASCGPKPTPTPVATEPPPTAVPSTAVPETTATPFVTPDANGCIIDWNPTYPEFTKYDPPLEIKIPFSASYSFNTEGETITDNPTYNLYLNRLGLKYTPALQADGGEYYTRLQNDMAAGTLPDVFRIGANSRLPTYIDSGAVEDITDIWNATASDLVKQKKGYPDSIIWRDVKRNGRIMGIAFMDDGMISDDTLFLRADWLEMVGMKAPTTLDEVTAVAQAFKDAGLCEFPIACFQDFVNYHLTLDPVFGAFGVIPAAGANIGYWIKGSDGKLRYGSHEPALKDALTLLKSWYDKELINPDFASMDEGTMGDALMAGQAGILWSYWQSGQAYVIDLLAMDPTIKVACIKNVVGPTGKSGRAGTKQLGAAYLFRKGVDPKIIEAVIKQLNWNLEMHCNWNKYQQYGEIFQGAVFTRGAEWDLDASCNMIQGATPFSEWRLGRDLAMASGSRGVRYGDWWNDTYKDVSVWAAQDPSTLNMAQKFIVNNQPIALNAEYLALLVSTLNERIPDAFQGPVTQAMADVMTDVVDFEKAALIEFISGTRDLAKFDDFVSEWKAQGGQTLIDEVNEWAAANP